MKPLKTMLLTGAATLALASAPAFAQDTGVSVGTDTGATTGVTAGTGNSSADVGATSDTDLKINNGSTDLTAGVDAEADVDAETDETMTAEVDGETKKVLSGKLGAIADVEISSLIGADVYSAEGNDVGELDNFAKVNGDLVAIVGIGGFLGMGEHSIAVDIESMTVADDNTIMIEGYTEEELKAMPEFDDANAVYVDASSNLRAELDS